MEANGYANGHDAKAIRQELRDARRQLRLQQSRLELRKTEKAAQLLEAFADVNWVTQYSDMLDRFRTPDQGSFNISTVNDRRYGRNYPIFQTEQELGIMRMQARILTSTNSYAIGLLEGLTSYVIGPGFQYRATAKKNTNCPDELLAAVQAIIDDFLDRNEWYGGEQPGLEEELFWRSCEDGEFFLTNFPDPDDPSRTTLRTVEPEQVTFAGSGWSWEEGSFGVLTERNDVQTVYGYWVFMGLNPADGEVYEPSDITHFRRNVKRSIKRGLTDFCFDTQDSLEMASKLRRNMAIGAALQAAIAIIREHTTATVAQAGSFQSAIADYQKTNQVSGQTQNFTRFDPGSVLDVPESMKYVPPPGATNATSHIEVLQAVLRSAGVRWNAPEWLSSGDASNNNFASALVADSPFVKKVSKGQRMLTKPFVRNVWIAVERYIRSKGCLALTVQSLDGISARQVRVRFEDIKQVVEIQCEPPSVESRDKSAEAQANQILNQAGVLSPQTWAQREGLDYDDESTNFDEFNARFGQAGLAMPNDPDQPGQADQQSTQESLLEGASAGQGGTKVKGADEIQGISGADALIASENVKTLPTCNGSFIDHPKRMKKLVKKMKKVINTKRQDAGKLPYDYVLKTFPTAAVTQSKFGNEYYDRRTYNLVKVLGTWGASDDWMDYAPVAVDENGIIEDGNHRHAARVILGFPRIDVLVPRGSRLDKSGLAVMEGFDESKVKRDKGQFANKPGAKGGSEKKGGEQSPVIDLDYLAKNTGPNATSSDPLKLADRPIPQGLDVVVYTAVRDLKSASANPFVSPTVSDVFGAVRKKTEASLLDVQAALVKLDRAKKLDLGPYTQALATIPKEDVAAVIPLDRDPKFFVRLR